MAWEKIKLTNEEIEIVIQELLSASDTWADASCEAYEDNDDQAGERHAYRFNLCQRLADKFDRCNTVELS